MFDWDSINRAACVDIDAWHAANAELTLKGHLFLGFSPDSSRLVTALGEGVLSVCDARTGKEDRTIAVGKGMILSAGCSPDGKRLVSVGLYGTAKVWDAATGEEILTLPGDTSRASYSPDGRIIAGACGNGVRLWDAATGRELTTLAGHTDRVYWISFSPDSHRLASASKDGTVKVWKTPPGPR